MIDVEALLVEELEALVPAPGAVRADWHDVEHRAGVRRPPRRFVLAGAGIAAAAFAAVAVAQTLGIGFSSWLTGEPGKPASTAEQRAFARSIRSWTGFPQSTELRLLAKTQVGGATFTLFGFRGAGSLCLRLEVTGSESARDLVCPPLSGLRNSPPALVAAADYRVGVGREVRNGPFDFTLPKTAVTFGIVSDGVTGVEVEHSDSGPSVATVNGDAFLSVDSDLSQTERVTRVWATASGSRVRIPFAPSTGLAGPPATARPAGFAHARGPAKADSPVRGGAVRWLARREPRGIAVPANVHHIVGILPSVLFAREITPDPGAPERLVVSVSPAGARYGSHLRNKLQVCVDVVGGRYAPAGGGCWPAGRLFAGLPFAAGVGGDPSGQYATIAGLASDTVARLELVLGNGAHERVPLHDNGFLVDAALADYPLRLVAYDANGVTTGVKTFEPQSGGGLQPDQRPIVNGRWRVAFRTTAATVWRGPSAAGTPCVSIVPANPGVSPPFCMPEQKLSPGAVGGMSVSGTKNAPALAIVDVGSGVKSVVVRYRDGRSEALPAGGGYAIGYLKLLPRPEGRGSAFAEIRSVTAYGPHGTRLGAQPSFGPLLTGGSGTITSLSGAEIAVGKAACRIGAASPPLRGLRAGVHVQYLCRGGALTLIARSAPNAPWPDRTVFTRGRIKAVSATAISLAEPGAAEPRRCSVGGASPPVKGYRVGQAVQVFCARGILTGINSDTG